MNGVTFCEAEEEIFAEKIDVRISGDRPGKMITGSFTVTYRRLDADGYAGIVKQIQELSRREKEGEDFTSDLIQMKRDTLDDVIVSVEGIGNSQGVYPADVQIELVKSKMHYLTPAFERFMRGHNEAPLGNSKALPRR